MKRILVTGSNGQLGSELYELSRKNEYPYEFYFKPHRELDITKPGNVQSFLEATPADYIINCAAYTDVDMAEKERQKAVLVNHTAVKNLVKASASIEAALIHISTDYVFEGTACIPYREEDEPNPLSVYGMSKLGGEQEVLNYGKGLVIRTSWLYSPVGRNFLNSMVNLGKEKNEIRVVYDQVGSPTSAADLAKVILDVIDHSEIDGNPFRKGLFHYANEGVCSRYDLAVEIMNAAKLSCRVIPVETSEYPTPAKRPHYCVLNKSKVKREYSIDIPYWKDSLLKCIERINL